MIPELDFAKRTFQVIAGLGPYRERDLWARGISTWEDFRAQRQAGAVLMSARLDAALARQLEVLEGAPLEVQAQVVPEREHWRLYGQFAPQGCAFFDIEADGRREPTVASVMDGAGLAVFRRDDHSLDALPERLAQSSCWVTFNGSTFDVPVLERYFGRLPRPACHIDLRFLMHRAELAGGLKQVERQLGLARPPHLEGLGGLDATRLWRAWAEERSLMALRILLEYNLYDTINLRAVLEQVCWRLAERARWTDLPPRPRHFERGEVLFDVSRLILATES